jgi:magnesium transporter
VFVGPNYLVTLPTVELLPITRLFRRCEEDEAFREQLFSKGSGRLLYEVLDDLFDYCFPILDKIGHKLDSLEDDVFEGRSEAVVRDISNVKQDYLDNYKEVVEALEDTNESVIAHRQNDVLRILTVFSVVLLPLTLITGFFGMNVQFPGFDTVWAFWVIFVGMVATLGGLLAFFRLKRWL